ncbi:MAG TPA: hypothetical protein VIF15_02985 [Polyangiaceae bacterium]
MAHPADTAPKGPAAFAGARLTPEDAERLAATFRPSWELDDAPFTGPGMLSEADLRGLQGGGTHADVRAAAHASNGTYPQPPQAQSHEPENSVVIDRSITAQDMAPARTPSAPRMPAAKAGSTTMMGMAPPLAAVAIAPVAPVPVGEPAPRSGPPPAPPVSRRPPAPMPFGMPQPPPAARTRAVSVDLDEPAFAKRSKTGLWVGMGAAGLLAVGIGIWVVSSGGPQKAAAPAPTAEATTNDRTSAIPPPPPETATATQTTAAPAAPPPPPATVAAATPPPPVAATAPTAPPAATHVAAAPPSPPRAWAGGGGGPQPPRPPPKKGGQTIVRDVPF